MNKDRLLETNSFIELGARERAQAMLDEGSMRELLGPFDRVKSPWLAAQGIVTQADDGMIVAKGTLNGVNWSSGGSSTTVNPKSRRNLSMAS